MVSITERAVAFILEQMHTQGITQIDLAERALIPRVTLQRRLAGASPFSIEELDRIGEVLGFDIAAMVGSAA